MRLFATAGIALATIVMGGCSSMLQDLAKDTANVCVGSIFPYGTVVGGRVNTPGATLDLNGTSCKITTGPGASPIPFAPMLPPKN